MHVLLETVVSDSCLPNIMTRLRNYLDTARKAERTGGLFKRSELMLRLLENQIKLSKSSAE